MKLKDLEPDTLYLYDSKLYTVAIHSDQVTTVLLIAAKGLTGWKYAGCKVQTFDNDIDVIPLGSQL